MDHMYLLQELLQEGPSGTGISITILTRGLEDVSCMIFEIEKQGNVFYYTLNTPY